MGSSLVILLLIGLAILFVLALGVGLLVVVMKRGKKSASTPPLPGHQPADATGGRIPPPMQPMQPMQMSDYAVPPSMAGGAPPAAPHAPRTPPPAPDAAPPGPPTDALDPALFETQRSEDRSTSPAARTRETTEQPTYRTAAGGNPVADYAPLDLFATTPSVQPEVPAPGPPPMAHLEGPDGAVPIGAAGIKIGRHPECDVVVPTPGASRQHAAVRFENGDWILEDLNSGNGTYVNGVRVRSHRLTPGDEVRVDQTVMTFGLGNR
jgi:hypothetical protein